jgi:hypothetical protein
MIEDAGALRRWHNAAELWHSGGAQIFTLTGARYAPEDSMQ